MLSISKRSPCIQVPCIQASTVGVNRRLVGCTKKGKGETVHHLSWYTLWRQGRFGNALEHDSYLLTNSGVLSMSWEECNKWLPPHKPVPHVYYWCLIMAAGLALRIRLVEEQLAKLVYKRTVTGFPITV
jgi:hypothetical protein